MRSNVWASLYLILGLLAITGCGGGGGGSTTQPAQAPANLAYGTNPADYPVGIAITANQPTSTGGAPTAYAVAPGLPAGLSLNTATGAITGTPTTITASATYTVTASNSGGSTTASLALSVRDGAPTALTYATPDAVYTKGVTIPINIPSHTGGTVTKYSADAGLPAGLLISATSGRISGRPTAAAARAIYPITASNGTGSTICPLAITIVEEPPTGLTYATTTASYPRNSVIAPNVPTVTGGTPSLFTVAPALPAGLSLDPATGVISGAPTVETAAAVYTVTASNTAGGTTAALTIAVTPADANVDLWIGAMELTQSTQTTANSVPVIAGKDGLARVFVVSNKATVLAPDVQVTLLNNGVPVAGYPKVVHAPAGGVPTAVDEGNLQTSWNLAIPGSDLTTPQGTGFRLQAVLDPQHLISETDESNNTSSVDLTVTVVPTFRTTIFPVVLSSGTGNVTDTNKDAWVAMFAKMYPVADVDVAVGPAFTGSISSLSDDASWSTLLSDLRTKHQADGSDRFYFGAVKVSYSSGTAGLGYVPSSSSAADARTALGWDKSAGYSDGGLFPGVFAHETGHNLGLSHAPCGTAGTPDPSFPYAGGGIGAYGYDSVLQLLYNPAGFKDIMGYCTPNWVSDYHYVKALARRTASSALVVSEAASECLLVRGVLQEDGTVRMLPGFRTRALPTPPAPAGDLRVVGRDAAGRDVFDVGVEALEVGCGTAARDRQFLLALPLPAAQLDAVATVQVHRAGKMLASRSAAARVAPTVEPEARRAPEDEVAVAWDAASHPAMMVRDADTGEVLAILSGGQSSFRTKASRLDLVLSDGVSGPTRHLETPR